MEKINDNELNNYSLSREERMLLRELKAMEIQNIEDLRKFFFHVVLLRKMNGLKLTREQKIYFNKLKTNKEFCEHLLSSNYNIKFIEF